MSNPFDFFLDDEEDDDDSEEAVAFSLIPEIDIDSDDLEPSIYEDLEDELEDIDF